MICWIVGVPNLGDDRSNMQSLCQSFARRISPLQPCSLSVECLTVHDCRTKIPCQGVPGQHDSPF